MSIWRTPSRFWKAVCTGGTVTRSIARYHQARISKLSVEKSRPFREAGKFNACKQNYEMTHEAQQPGLFSCAYAVGSPTSCKMFGGSWREPTARTLSAEALEDDPV